MSLNTTPFPTTTQNTVSLLAAEPDLAAWIPVSDRRAAMQAIRVPEVILEPGPFDPQVAFGLGREGFGALIVSGLLAREFSLGERPALKLLGPGDVFFDESWGAGRPETTGAWNASLTTHLALLDDHLLIAVRRWPRLLRGICALLQECHDNTLLQLSVSHRPAVEDRIVGLFALLGTRWGRMTPEGIVVPIPLTHDAIGQMIGARRPTVTLGLKSLARKGRLQRHPGGRWLLEADLLQRQPPGRREPLTVVRN